MLAGLGLVKNGLWDGAGAGVGELPWHGGSRGEGRSAEGGPGAAVEGERGKAGAAAAAGLSGVRSVPQDGWGVGRRWRPRGRRDGEGEAWEETEGMDELGEGRESGEDTGVQ